MDLKQIFGINDTRNDFRYYSISWNSFDFSTIDFDQFIFSCWEIVFGANDWDFFKSDFYIWLIFLKLEVI